MSEEKTGIFRAKNMEAISSPESLEDYLKVTAPGVWIFLAAVVCLLAGVIIWGCLGYIDSTVDVAVVSEDGTRAIVAPYESYESILAAGEVTINEKSYALDTDQLQQGVIDESTDPRILIEGGLAKGDYVVLIGLKEAPANEGIFSGSVVTERIKPITLLLQ